MVSGADTLESEPDHMETEQETVDNHDDNDNAAAVNGNTSNGNNVDTDHTADNNMEIETSHKDQNSILSNPGRFECLIRLKVRQK